jgi:hypothetical protein
MTFGEPEDKIIRAKDKSTRELWGASREAADLLSATGAYRLGVNDQFVVGLLHISHDWESDDVIHQVPLDALGPLPEDELPGQLKVWAIRLVQIGHTRDDAALTEAA